ncbi:MAG: arginase family protein, partial [Nitrospirae bacterium]|nr:arginase family protein [Nitrospirota bacterium]
MENERALILDFDHSVLPLAGARTVAMNEWQGVIRYGCSLADLERLEAALETKIDDGPRLSFLGSGDFHHVSYLMIKRLHSKGSFQVVVFDNHPDNMRFPWGIHCGSWVHHVCRLPFVSRVTVIGITSGDIRGYHLFENHLRSLFTGKLTYLCLAPVPPLA